MLIDRRGVVHGSETLNQDYAGRVPVLSYFDLKYEKAGDPDAQIDNNLRGLAVSSDLNASTLNVGMYDKSPTDQSDRVAYRVVTKTLPAAFVEPIRRVRQDGIIAIQRVRLIDLDEVQAHSHLRLLLSGFRLELRENDDHQIYSVGIVQGEVGQIFAEIIFHREFSLGLADMSFDWDVQFAWVSPSQLAVAAQTFSGRATGSAQLPIPNAAPTNILGIRLFHLKFVDAGGAPTHHKVRRIALGQVPGTTNFEVAFHDKNADDLFDYDVRCSLLNN